MRGSGGFRGAISNSESYSGGGDFSGNRGGYRGGYQGNRGGGFGNRGGGYGMSGPQGRGRNWNGSGGFRRYFD